KFLDHRHRLLLRLSRPLLVLSGLLMTLGIGGAVYLQQMQMAQSRELADRVTGILAAEQLVLAVREVRMALNRYFRSGEREALNELPPHVAERDRWLGQAEHVGKTEDERTALAGIRRGIAHFDDELTGLLSSQPNPDREDIRRLAMGTLTNEV